jgi:hypothetical protein
MPHPVFWFPLADPRSRAGGQTLGTRKNWQARRNNLIVASACNGMATCRTRSSFTVRLNEPSAGTQSSFKRLLLAIVGEVISVRTCQEGSEIMSKLEKPGSRTSRSLISMAFEVAQQNEILQARIEVLERENKRLRATLDAVRETSLDAQTEALRDRARRVVLISPRQKKVA